MRTILAIWLGSAMYATLRYNVFKGVPWGDWPTYVLNKTLALSALLLLLAEVLRCRRSRPGDGGAGFMGAIGLFALMHAGLSLALLRPEYFASFFEAGKLTAAAGTATLVGVAAMAGLVTRRAQPGWLALAVGVHAMFPGYAGWFTPEKWPGHLPPITLISFVVALAAFGLAYAPQRRT